MDGVQRSYADVPGVPHVGAKRSAAAAQLDGTRGSSLPTLLGCLIDRLSGGCDFQWPRLELALPPLGTQLKLRTLCSSGTILVGRVLLLPFL